MKVSQAIEMLTKYYTPDDELIIAWWDKEWVNGGRNTPISEDTWIAVAERSDDIMENASEGIAYAIEDAVNHELELENPNA